MTNDVEKRWSSPSTFRHAALYAGIVVAIAVLELVASAVWLTTTDRCAGADHALCDTTSRVLVAGIPPAVLLVGGFGALVQAYRNWRHGRNWPIWQGAGWFLLILMVVTLGAAWSSLAGG